MSAHTQPNVLVLGGLPEAAKTRLAAHTTLHIHPHLTDADLLACIPDMHALLIRPETRLPADLLDHAVQMQCLGVLGGSHSHLRPAETLRHGIELITVHDPATGALAEHTLRLLLELNQPLAGRTLGLIGFGSVGSEVARRAQAFDLRVLVNQPRPTLQLALADGVQQMDLLDLLAQADFVSIHVSERPETNPLLTTEHIQRLKPGAHLLNLSHLTAIDLQALPSALSHRVAGVWLSHRSSDGALPHAVAALPNVTLVPLPAIIGHDEVDERLANALAERVLSALMRQQPGNQLSLEVVPIDKVLPHEHYDPERVAALAVRLASEETLTNPPLAIAAEGHYIVLDGATRTNAFKQLGYPHIVVQVVDVDDPALKLGNWNHILSGVTTEEVLSALERLDGLVMQATSQAAAAAALESGAAPFAFVTPTGDWHVPQLNATTDPLRAVNAAVAAYTKLNHCTIVRTLGITPSAVRMPQFAGLFVFRAFTVPQVIAAGLSRDLLPAGVTRFLVPGRVLRLHADIARLQRDEPLPHKQAWLDKLVAAKYYNRQVRFYEEPVILLDE